MYDACTFPLMEWVVRVNVAAYKNEQDKLEIHSKAWYNAVARIYSLGEDVDPWKHVNGRAMACILTLLRIKWTPATRDGWTVWQNRDGGEIDITVQPLASVKQWLREDIEKHL